MKGYAANGPVIDWAQPVNLTHPLNVGLERWWRCVPGATGSQRWVDLCRAGEPGRAMTLTNMNPVTDWVTASQRGLFGALDFDATDDYTITTNVQGIPSGANARTIAFWMYQRSRTNGVNSAVVRISNGTDGAGVQIFALQFAQIGGQTFLFTDAENGLNNIVLTGAEIPSLNVWNHIVFTMDGLGRWVYWLNGAITKTGTFTVAINTGVTQIELARRTGYYDGLLDSVRVYSRSFAPGQSVMSSGEGTLLYVAEQGGCAGMLNRISLPNGYQVPAAGASVGIGLLESLRLRRLSLVG